MAPSFIVCAKEARRQAQTPCFYTTLTQHTAQLIKKRTKLPFESCPSRLPQLPNHAMI